MAELPVGTVTFLFTDIEGSTRLWEGQPRAMAAALARHDDLLTGAVEAHGGRVFKTVGDAVCAAFPLAAAAVAAGIAAQQSLAAEPRGEVGPLRVRMAVHAGAAEERDDDYFGPPLNRVARLLAVAHGGQILLSRAAHELARDQLPAGVVLRDLGEHRLKDLTHPERVFQVVAPDLPADFPPPRTAASLLHNLPVHPTPLIGREAEVEAARAHFRSPETRLVTLTGPGGAGKTRLGLHLAGELAVDFADGVWFVSLASLTDPELVLPEIAATLGVPPGEGSPRDLVREELRHRHLLLVLDNFEQIMTAAPLVADLLAGCPRLAVLATSREPLRLRGERELPVPPLAMPDPEGGGGLPPVDEVARCEAIRLFVERAGAVKPGFALGADNVAAVVEICRRLDGLPLAIELAAARVRLLPPKAMVGRLGSRLDLLVGGARDLPARQQTMRDTIAWSYDLLDPAEQHLFARLAIFLGGCTLDAAEAVAEGLRTEDGGLSGERALSALGPQSSVLDVVSSLAEKSLVRLEEDGGEESRLGMLETIRDYGLERLAAIGEAEAIGRRHAEFFLELAEEAEPALEGGEQTRWLDRLERDHANLRTAIAWLRDRGETEPALRLGGALWRFWWLRGYITEGRSQLGDLLRRAGEAGAAVRAKALNGAGVLADSQGDFAEAAAFHEESLAIARALGDQRGIAWSLNNLGIVALDQGDHERARLLLEENLVVAEAAGDTPSVATALMDLGQIAHHLGDDERAQAFSMRSLALFREVGDESCMARVLTNLGGFALGGGACAQAEALLSESLTLLRTAGEKQSITSTLNNLAEAVKCLGDEERAMGLFEESRALAVETGNRLCAASALESLAGLDQRRGRNAQARFRYREALLLYQGLGDWPGIAACLAGLAGVAAEVGRAEGAARLFGAAAGICEAHGLQAPDADDDALGGVRSALREGGFAEAWRAGHDAPIERIISELGLVLG